MIITSDDLILPLADDVRIELSEEIANSLVESYYDFSGIKEIMLDGFKGICDWSDEEIRDEWLECFCSEHTEFIRTTHELGLI